MTYDFDRFKYRGFTVSLFCLLNNYFFLIKKDESKRKLRLDEIETHIPISFHISAPGVVLNLIFIFDLS